MWPMFLNMKCEPKDFLYIIFKMKMENKAFETHFGAGI